MTKRDKVINYIVKGLEGAQVYNSLAQEMIEYLEIVRKKPCLEFEDKQIIQKLIFYDQPNEFDYADVLGATFIATYVGVFFGGMAGFIWPIIFGGNFTYFVGVKYGSAICAIIMMFTTYIGINKHNPESLVFNLKEFKDFKLLFWNVGKGEGHIRTQATIGDLEKIKAKSAKKGNRKTFKYEG